MVLLTFLAPAGHSQQKTRKSAFGANGGVALPTHEFAYSSFGYDAGFASPGPDIEAEYLYYGNYFGFSSEIGYTSFFFNEKAYKSEYDRILEGFGTNYVTAGNYQALSFMVGFMLKIPEIKHTEVMLLFHLGYAVSIHPNLRVTNSELGVINSVDRNSGGNPLANAGIKINYWLNERYGVSLNCNLNTTRPGFTDKTGPGGSFFLPINYTDINIGFVMDLKAPSL